MKLVKTHGSLNEIFALDAAPDAWASGALLREFVRRVCDRSSWTGGSDGIYLYDASGPNARAWFFNPDGSSAEFCGNGMRGLGRLILDLRGTDTEVVSSGGRDYTVHRAPSTPEGVRQVLLELPPLRFDDAGLPAPFEDFTSVAVPNPHVIAVVGEYSEPDLIELGKRAGEVFAEGANVSFLQPLDDTEPDNTGLDNTGPARPARVAVHRHAVTWHVTIFMGMQSLLYYATLSWLPTMLRDRGESAAAAGDLLALMGVGNLAVSLFIPTIAQRMRSQTAIVVPTTIAVAAGLAGLLYLPLGGAVVWALILGAGQNAALALAIFFTAARAPHAAAAASLSSLAQAVGYLLASAGPLEVGLLHSATGSWTAPVMVLFVLSGVMLVAGVLAARPRMLPGAASPDPANPDPASPDPGEPGGQAAEAGGAA